MSRMIFVNLPVRDLDKSMAFFKALGFEFNPQFTDKTAACMIVSESSFAMLLTHPKFGNFTPKPIADAKVSTEVLTAISFESRAKVDELVAAAIKAGGREIRDPEDHGFMYQRSIEDLDGHIWEVFWFNPEAVKAA